MSPSSSSDATYRSAPPLATDYRLRGLVIDETIPVPTPPPRPERHPRVRQRHLPIMVEVAALVAVAVLALWVLQAFVVQPYAVAGATMTPAMQAGDRILIVKAGPLVGPIHGGEVIVLRPPRSLSCAVAGGQTGDLVLRVVAMPGQAIWSVGNTIFVDGRPLHERGWYDPRFGPVGSTPVPSTTLSQNQYFVMGDNRSLACDSRAFGPISRSAIVGKGVAIVVRRGHIFFRSL